VALAAVAALTTLAGCGGGQRQDVSEPSGNFTVAVLSATFPPSQRLSQHTHMTIRVRNLSNRTIPDVAVSVCNITCAYPAPGEGTTVRPFSEPLNMPYNADPSRPVWIVEEPPGQCGYSCQNGGPGSAVTPYSNTWALGSLAPGATATFTWAVTAVKAGRHVVAWQVAAGVNGKAKAVLPNGLQPKGTFVVNISGTPRGGYVTQSGRVVTTP